MSDPRSFPTARTHVVFAVMTGFVITIPIAFLFIGQAAPVVRGPMFAAAALVLAMTAITWLTARPTRFEVDGEGVHIAWPLRRQLVPRASIVRARVMTKRDVDAAMGGALRVGVGGLFGVFGLLKTTKLGWVSCYITTVEPLVLIERSEGRSLLVSPSDPEAFVKQLSP